AVREEEDEQVALRVDPQRRPRVPAVTERPPREERAPVARVAAVEIPPERARALRRVVACGEPLERLFAEQPAPIERAVLEHRAREPRHVARGGEHTGVAGDPAERERAR